MNVYTLFKLNFLKSWQVNLLSKSELNNMGEDKSFYKLLIVLLLFPNNLLPILQGQFLHFENIHHILQF